MQIPAVNDPLSWANLLPIILTSAAIGAVVSSILQLIGNYFERKARRREQLLRFAIEMAVQRTELVMRISEKTDASVKLQDNIFMATKYYRWLDGLERHGTLPPDAIEAAERSGVKL